MAATHSSSYGHAISPLVPGEPMAMRNCTLGHGCGEAVLYIATHRCIYAHTGRERVVSRAACARHGQTFAKQHRLLLPAAFLRPTA